MTAVSTASRGAASRSLAALGLGGFVVLGLPDGMWGTAWPTMRHTFHQPLGSLGLILVFGTLGNLVTSLSTGRTLRRFGVGRLLVVAGLIAASGALLIAISTVWAMVLIGALLLGMAAGLLDTGLNTVIALSGRLRLLNLLHGAYGVGSAIGPLVVTAAILMTSWRPAYFLLIALELLLAYGWWRTSSHWTPDVADDGETVAAVDAPDDGPTKHIGLLVGLGVGAFFFYTGLEVTAGQWAASFFRGPLGLSAGSAGPAVFAYWGSLTAARFATAIPRRTPNPVLLVRLGCIGGLAASALIWWAPSTAVVIVGFALLGAVLAPVFPALVTLTPVRIGAARAQHAIGWHRRRQRGGGWHIGIHRHHLATRRLANTGPVPGRDCRRVDRLQRGVGVVQPALIQTATWLGCTLRLTTSMRSRSIWPRSTASRNPDVKPAMVASAS